MASCPLAEHLTPQLSYLVSVALQPQPLNSSLKVPDPNGKVVGRGG